MSNDVDQQIAALTTALKSGALAEADYEAIVAALRQQATYQADADHGSGIAQDHSIALAAGAMFNDYEGEPTDDPFEALQKYRKILLGSTSTLPLRGVDVGASDPSRAKQLGLANVYIELDTTSRFVALSARQAPEKEDRPKSALEALLENRQLVLTGEPGGGKSTFVNHLAYCLAVHALYPDDGWLDHLPDWPAGKADLLPIVVTLRDFAATLDPWQSATPGALWQFIADQLKAQNLAFASKAVETELREGRAIVLLDGLDEVTGTALRQRVRDAVAAFARPPFAGNRYLVTCRILSSQPPDDEEQPDLRLDPTEFPVFELAPFDEAKIDRFIDAWYAELARVRPLGFLALAIWTDHAKEASSNGRNLSPYV